MANNINVKLDSSKTPPVLDVEDNGGLQVPKGQVTTIAWNLTGTLAQGSFAEMDGTNPGFEWMTPPPDGIFGKAELKTPNRMEITDNHAGSGSAGEWVYKLRVVYKNKIYATTGHFVSASSKDPVIINKDP